jgi:hypothetical protein
VKKILFFPISKKQNTTQQVEKDQLHFVKKTKEGSLVPRTAYQPTKACLTFTFEVRNLYEHKV